MNMRIFNSGIILIAVAAIFSSCRKDVIADFKVNQETVLDPSLEKDRDKTNKQAISILYTSLFQKAISSNNLFQTENVIESFGDKALINEVIVSNYMNSPDVVLPSDSFMRANPDQFIKDTYKLFYVRIPSELEISFFREYIAANPNVTVELVYTAFASSDEYQFY
ncbi:MAG: hypothetical protein GC181_11930 [Bacteroidetes bacterium]|nr:hypothetical protein [Bacteroidota bacterium]